MRHRSPLRSHFRRGAALLASAGLLSSAALAGPGDTDGFADFDFFTGSAPTSGSNIVHDITELSGTVDLCPGVSLNYGGDGVSESEWSWETSTVLSPTDLDFSWKNSGASQNVSSVRVKITDFTAPDVVDDEVILQASNGNYLREGDALATVAAGDFIKMQINIPPDNGRGQSVAGSLELRPAECIPPNLAPVCDFASASRDKLWPPNHKFKSVEVINVTDPDGDEVTITIDSIFQDEDPAHTGRRGKRMSFPDAIILGDGWADIRAERVGRDNGRYYHIGFTADDGNGGTCQGSVTTSVAKSQSKKGIAVDDGPLYQSTE